MTARATLERLLQGVPHEVLHHPPAGSAEEMAAVRGTPLEIGGKALVMKLGDRFALIALRADERLEGRAVRRGLGVQRYRFATREELHDLTGLAPGCVPPFGRPVFALDLVVSEALASGEEIAFSLADPTYSARMRAADWLAIARPEAVLPLGRGG